MKLNLHPLYIAVCSGSVAGKSGLLWYDDAGDGISYNNGRCHRRYYTLYIQEYYFL